MKNKPNKFSGSEAINQNENNLKKQSEDWEKLEEIEIFNKIYTAEWAEKILDKDKKWNEKKELLDEFINYTKYLKFQKTNRSHVVASFQKLLKDSNQNVVNTVINCINSLCLGLRSNFKESKEFFWPLLDKFKEKKDKIFKDTQICLENFILLNSISHENFYNEIYEYTKKEERAPIVKERICILIESVLKRTYSKDLKGICKELSEYLHKLSDDASGEVRNSALQILGLIKAKIGEQAISSVVNEINNIKKKKIDEAAEVVILDPIYDNDSIKIKNDEKNNNKNLKVNDNSNNIPVVIANTNNKGESDKMDIDYESSYGGNINLKTNINNSSKSNLQKSLSSGNLTLKSNISVLNKTSKNNTANNLSNKNTNKETRKPEDNIDFEDDKEENLNLEEIEKLIKSKIGDECYNLFSDGKWENRKNGFIKLNNLINENSIEYNSIFSILFKFIKIKLKDFKENNFNILREAFILYENLVERCSSFTRKHANIIIKNFSDKIGDQKLKTQMQNLLTKINEFHSPKITTSNLIKHFSKNVKGANSLKEFSLFLEKSIDEFGINQFPVKEIIDFSILLETNANKDLRKTATSLLCCMYKYLGDPIKRFLTEIKEATLKEINEEFSKVTVITKDDNKGKRALKGEAAFEENGNTGKNLMDSLFPRVDISKKITAQIIKELTDGKTNVKKDVFGKLEKILEESNMRIMSNGLNPLMTALKNNINDSNKSLVRIILQFYTKLLDSLGTGSKQFTKLILPGILNNLSDTQSFVREDSIKVIHKWFEINEIESIIALSNTYLIKDNLELRTELLGFFLKNKKSLEKCDLTVIIEGVIACLLDRNIKIRNLAESLASEMIQFVHINHFHKVLSKYKPEISNSIKSIIDKYGSINMTKQIEKKTTNNPLVNNNTNPVNNIVNNNINKNKNFNEKELVNDKMSIVYENHSKETEMPNIRVFKMDEEEKNKLNYNNNKIIPITNNITKNININIPNINSNYNNVNNNSNISNILQPVINNQNNNENVSNTNTLNNPDLLNKAQNKNNILFFLEESTKPKQKMKRSIVDQEMDFPDDFVIGTYKFFLNDSFNNIITELYVELAFSSDLKDLKRFFNILYQIIEKNFFKFQENSDILLKLLLIRFFEIKKIDEGALQMFEEIFYSFLENIVLLVKKRGNFLEKFEMKFIFEILFEIIIFYSLKGVLINNSINASKYLDSFTNIYESEDLLLIHLNFMKRKNEKNDLKSIFIYTDLFNRFLKNKILSMKFSNSFNFEMFEPILLLIENPMFDNICKIMLKKDLNRIYDFLNEENKIKMETTIINKNFNITKYLDNPRLKSEILINNNNNNINNINNNQYIKQNNLEKIDNNKIQSNKICDNTLNDHPSMNNPNIKNIHNQINPNVFNLNTTFEVNSTFNEIINNTLDDYQTFIDNKLNKLKNGNYLEKENSLREIEKVFFNSNTPNQNKLNLSIIFNNNINKFYLIILEVFRDLIINLEKDKSNLLKIIFPTIRNPLRNIQYAKNISKECLIEVYKYLISCHNHLENLNFSDDNNIEKLNAAKNIISIIVSDFTINTNLTNSLCALFELLGIYHKDKNFVQKFSMIIYEINTKIKNQEEQTEIDKILFSILITLNDIDKDPLAFSENNQNPLIKTIIKIIKQYLTVIIGQVKEKIFDYYNKGIDNVTFPDKFLKKMIQGKLRQLNGYSTEVNLKIMENPSQAIIDFISSNNKNTISSSNNKNQNNLITNTLNNSNNQKYQQSALSLKSTFNNNQFHSDQENEFKNLIKNFLQLGKEVNQIDSLNKKKIALRIITYMKNEKLPFNILRNYLNELDINYFRSLGTEVLLQSEIANSRENTNNLQMPINQNKITDFEALLTKVTKIIFQLKIRFL